MWYDWNYPYYRYDNYPSYAYTSYEHPNHFYYPGRVYTKSRNPFLKNTLVSNPPRNVTPSAPTIAPELGQTSLPRPKSAAEQRKERPHKPSSRNRSAISAVVGNGQPQVYHFTDFPPFPAPHSGENNLSSVSVATPGPQTQLQHYAFPQARMYPYVPPGMQPMQQHVARQEPGPSSHGAATLGNAATPFSYPHYPYPSNQGQAITNPVAVHPDDLKYKCTICGKFRSSRYQWKHRVPAGQLPRPTICKNCRAEATDSEDEDTDSYEERDYRHRAKDRKRSSRIPIARSPRSRSRARSSSRASRRNFDYGPCAAKQRYESSLESSSGDEQRRQRAGSRRRRVRSDSAEVVKYVNLSALKPKLRRKKKVIYVDSGSQLSDGEEEDEEVEVEYIRMPSKSRRQSIGGHNTPAPRAVLRHFSDPQLPTPVVVERREYYDGPTQLPQQFEGRPSSSRYRSSRNSLRRYRSVRSPPIRERGFRGYEAEEAHEDTYNADYDRPRRGRMRGGGSHSRNHSHDRVSPHEGPDAGACRAWSPHAFPPPRRRRSSSVTYAQLEPHENVTVIKKLDDNSSAIFKTTNDLKTHPRKLRDVPTNDYDWYDEAGMRVRVREI